MPGPDAQRNVAVPQGRIEQFTFDQSHVYPGTTRKVSVYIPAQYSSAKPACLMIFQDGSGYASVTSGAHTPIVLDNLIADGSIPPMIGIFVDPGVTPPLSPTQMARFHRSLEYDGIGDGYARFLIEDLIPEVQRRYNLKISADPNDRGLLGGSSGGIASFVAAWRRPDSFRRVISYIGSFTDLRGGDTLSDLVRKVEPKPLRIFMQDGSNDQSIYGGSWFQANQSLAASLEYAGYDVKFVIGTEGHSGRQGAAILPEALRWVWRDYPKPITASRGGPGQRHYVTDFLNPGSDWTVAGDGFQSACAPAVDKDGNVYFADTAAARIYRIVGAAPPVLFRDRAPAVDLMFGADGTLYSAEPARRRIAAYAASGAERTVAQNVNPHSLAVTSKGLIYFTDPSDRSIWLLEANGRKQKVFQASAEQNIQFPSAIRLLPDEHLVDVSDGDTRWVWSFEIAPDNTLRYGMPFHHLEIPDESSVTGAGGLTHDNTGHVYVTTNLGIQISDPPGRVVGIVRNPSDQPMTGIVFGGPDLSSLYVTTRNKVYIRGMRRAGTYPWQPVQIPRPVL